MALDVSDDRVESKTVDEEAPAEDVVFQADQVWLPAVVELTRSEVELTEAEVELPISTEVELPESTVVEPVVATDVVEAIPVVEDKSSGVDEDAWLEVVVLANSEVVVVM